MKKSNFVLSALLAISVATVAQQSAPPSTRPGSTPPSSATVNPAPQSAFIRILTPTAGKAVQENAVQLRFELTNRASAAGSPNYQIQLDGNDPINTSSTEYTFTGLAPGQHSVTVILVDANGTPISGGRAVVQFSVKNPSAATRAPGGLARLSLDGQPIVAASMPEELSTSNAKRSGVGGGGSLTVLSLIGFGVLIGGFASAMKNNRR